MAACGRFARDTPRLDSGAVVRNKLSLELLWRNINEGELSVVRYEWHVHSTRRWVNLIAPFARSMFIRNHGVLMGQGAEGLARQLDAPLVSQENIDLMAETTPPAATLGGVDPEPRAPRERSS